MDELISRQVAMNAFAERVKRSNNSDFAPTPTWNDAVEIVENQTSVDAVEIVTEYCRKRNLVIIARESFRVLQEERKRGNWVRIDDGSCECNVCGFVLGTWLEGAFYNFCPNCGADMRGGQDGCRLERRWIPVSERLPEIPIRVQVQLDNDWIITAYYDEGEWYAVPGDDEPIDGVLAWMPLPELWREKDESN